MVRAIRALRDANAKLARNESETQRKDAEAVIAQMKRHEGTEILNLTYRQGPDLPVLQDGFPDSHFICFPYESSGPASTRRARCARPWTRP